MVYKRPALLNWNLLRIFSQGQHTEAVVQRGQVCISSWQQNLIICVSLPHYAGLGCIKTVGLKSSWGGSVGRGHWWSCSLSCSEVSRIVEMLGLWKDHQEKTANVEVEPNCPCETSCMCHGWQSQELGPPSSLEPIRSWVNPRGWKRSYLHL